MTGEDETGGLAGLNKGGTISGSQSSANVSGTGDTVGGLVGKNQGRQEGKKTIAGVISNSSASGEVESTGSAGGLVGYNLGSISNSHASGDVTGGEGAGGLVGTNGTSGSISNSRAEGNVDSGMNASGLAGVNMGSIANSHASGDVTSANTAGGLVGFNTFGGAVSASYATGSITGTGAIGGLVGINDASASIVNSYATGDATNTNSTGAAGNWVGGLVGDNLGSIKAAYATGKVANSTSWQGIVGGLAGRNAGTIDSVYATGQITSNNVGGGLIGDNQAGIVTNAYWDRESTGKMYAVSSGDGTGIGNISDGISPYFSNSYLNLNNGGKAWTTLVGADSTVRVAKDAKGKVVWVIIDGATRPFLASEWSTNITNLHQLQLMSMNLKAKYVLANDISIPAGVMPVLDINGNLSTAVNKSGMWSNLGFMPVGTAKYSAFNNKITTTPFAGSFDGQGHSISGLVINRAGGLDPDNMGLSNFLGMFGVNSGKISNITLNNVYVVGPTQSQTFNSVVVPGSTGVGALVGLNLRGSISNAHVANSVRDFNATKGIVSAFAGGGLVGINVGGSIANSSAAIYVRNSGYFAGGLVGLSLNGKISGSRAVGAVSSSGASGGLVGMNTGTIDQSRADGDLNSGSMLMGGWWASTPPTARRLPCWPVRASSCLPWSRPPARARAPSRSRGHRAP